MVHHVGFVAPSQPDRIELMAEMARSHTDLELHVITPHFSPPHMIAACSPYSILILGTRVSMQVLDGCPRLEFVQLMSAGYDSFDIAALRARQVAFANSSAPLATAVAEHAFLLMLATKHRLLESWLSVQNRQWSGDVRQDLISELGGSTVGIVGLGHIGREVAAKLHGWNVTTTYVDAVRASMEVEQSLGVRWTCLDDMLADSDVVTLHVPLGPSTYHMIGADQLRQMKSTAILVNTCRGPVVDQEALYRALVEGWIAGAGLDVLETEPPQADQQLLNLPNVLVTPHIAGATQQRVKRATAFALDNVERFLAGKLPLSLVGG